MVDGNQVPAPLLWPMSLALPVAQFEERHKTSLLSSETTLEGSPFARCLATRQELRVVFRSSAITLHLRPQT